MPGIFQKKFAQAPAAEVKPETKPEAAQAPSMAVLHPAHKAALRQEMLRRRRMLAPEQCAVLSRRAAGLLLESDLWRRAEVVGLYVAARGEAETTALLEEAWGTGRKVLLPRCIPHEAGHMEFAVCAGWADLQRGAFGVLEPHPEHCPAVFSPYSNTCLIRPTCLVVPGVAFDRLGARLGMGGGYYDRFLPWAMGQGVQCVGFAFHQQLVPQLPHDAWDVPMHAVCTEEEFLWMPQ